MIRFVTMTVWFVLAGIACAGDEALVIRLSEPVEQTADSETFGEPLDQSVPAVALAQIAADADDYVGSQVRVQAQVSLVCQKKGCFFIARQGDTVMRVSFKGYGFFVPTDISGKRVTLVGVVVAKDLTKQQAEHFAEDLGAPAEMLQAGEAYEIVATSVRVPRS